MSKVTFDGMGELVATFQAGSVVAGAPVMMNGNNTVRSVSNGGRPMGVALHKRGDYVAVQLKGFARVQYTGSPALGWNSLVGNGTGGLRPATEAETGQDCLVVDLDSSEQMMGLFL